MPGITGIISALPVQEQKIDQMVDSMMHEKFYTSGTYCNEVMGCHTGWVAHEDSFSDGMPIWNDNKDVCLIFTGEEFSDKSDIDNIMGPAPNGDGHHAGYLIEMYQKFGLAMFERLNGWFSGIILDMRESKVILFNDRYGLGRLYIHEDNAQVYFSSEAKSILKILPQLRSIDEKGFAEKYSCGCVLQNRTVFSNISLLPAGSFWVLNGKSDIVKRRYFSLDTVENQPTLGEDEYYQKLKQTFVSILPKYFKGIKPVGISLTGGLDSRMIISCAGRPKGELPCYSFGGTYRDCRDVKIAKKIANICHQPHQTITVDSNFFGQFAQLAQKAIYVSDGTMDVTGAVELYINRIARTIAPVRMTGNYGSEIFRRNVAFKPSLPNTDLLDPGLAAMVKESAETYNQECLDNKLSFVISKQVPWHHFSRLSVEQSQLTLRTPFLDNELVDLIYQSPPALTTSSDISLRLIDGVYPELSKVPTDRGLLYQPLPVIGILRHLYEEFTYRSEYMYDYGMPQWLSRIDHFLSPLRLERLFLGRQKFYHFRVWYRDVLGQYIKDVLLDKRALDRSYLNGQYLEYMITTHISGEKNFTKEIHWALTHELMHRSLID